MQKTIIAPNERSTFWGIGYLLFQMQVLPSILVLVFSLLHLPEDNSLLNLVYYSVNFLATVIIFRGFLGDSLRHARQNMATVLKAAVIGFFASRFLCTLVDVGIYYLFPGFFNVNDANIATMSKDQLPLWAFFTIVLVPPTEELLFRGSLFAGLFNKYKIGAWIVSVLGFSLMHILGYVDMYSWQQLLICMVQYLPAGICLVAAYRYSGNILSPMLIHAAINALAMISLARMS